MSEAKYTAGPWEGRSIPGHLFELSGPEGVIMRIRSGMMPAYWDAQLIAAAPRMYERLSELAAEGDEESAVILMEIDGAS